MHDCIEKKTTWKQGPKSSEGIVPLKKKKKKDCQSILNSKVNAMSSSMILNTYVVTEKRGIIRLNQAQNVDMLAIKY